MAGWNLGWLGFAPKKWNKNFKKTLFGDEEKLEKEQVSRLTPEQQKLHDQYGRAIQGPGAGGAFGDAADYWRDLMSSDSQTMQQLSAPENRRFNEEIIPGLSEQFAGMGSGGLSSSGFRNAAVNAGTDLSERLGAIRANLRNQGAQGLANFAQGYLNPVVENVERYSPPTGGLMDLAGPALAAAGTAFAGPIAGAATGAIGQGISNIFSKKGKSSPYGSSQLNAPFQGSTNTYNSSPYGMQGMR